MVKDAGNAGKDFSGNPAFHFLRANLEPKVSPVRVCFTSKSGAGAWQIRGEQIAFMRSNWEAINKPSEEDIDRFDVFCIVKRANWDFVDKIRNAGKAVVYDVVDAWPKPKSREQDIGLLKSSQHLAKEKAFEILNPWEMPSVEDAGCATAEEARKIFRHLWDPIKADAYIFATEAMRRDLAQLVDFGITIYHHYWPQIGLNPVREKVLTLGHEGNPAYLDEWKPVIERLCDERGIRFVVNPSTYTDMDVAVIVRGGRFKSFMISSYKSNVKLANAYGSGTPALVHVDELSAHDTDDGDVLFFSDADSLARQLDRLCQSYELRQRIHESFLRSAKKYSIEHIANQFEILFQSVLNSKSRML